MIEIVIAIIVAIFIYAALPIVKNGLNEHREWIKNKERIKQDLLDAETQKIKEQRLLDEVKQKELAIQQDIENTKEQTRQKQIEAENTIQETERLKAEKEYSKARAVELQKEKELAQAQEREKTIELELEIERNKRFNTAKRYRRVQSNLKRKDKELTEREDQIVHKERSLENKEGVLAGVGEQMKAREYMVQADQKMTQAEKKEIIVMLAGLEVDREKIKLEGQIQLLELSKAKDSIVELIRDFGYKQREWSIAVKNDKLKLYEQRLSLFKKAVDDNYHLQLQDIEIRKKHLQNDQQKTALERDKLAIDKQYAENQLLLKNMTIEKKNMDFDEREMKRKEQVMLSIEEGWHMRGRMWGENAVLAFKNAGYIPKKMQLAKDYAQLQELRNRDLNDKDAAIDNLKRRLQRLGDTPEKNQRIADKTLELANEVGFFFD